MASLDLNFDSTFTEHIIGGLNKLLPLIPVALFDFVLGFILIRWIVRGSRIVMKFLKVPPGLRGVVASTLETLLWIFLTITILNDLGFKSFLSFFVGSFAAIGLAMAVGGSTLISDIVAGIFLARDSDFNVGDKVSVGEGPTVGIIESMDARRTRLRGEDGALHIIPNSIVERKEWILLKRRGEITAMARAATTAKRIGAAALDKSPKLKARISMSRENAQ